MKRAYVNIPEGQIHYRIDGSGEPLLLLHQTAFSSDEYSLVMPILSKSYQVIAMDTMGYGMSGSPPRVFKIEDYARSVRGFLFTLGIKETSIAGHHTGATIALEIAAAYPEIVDKLILSGCPYYDPEERQERRARYRPMEITDDGSYLTKMWEMLRRYMPHARPEDWHKFLIAGLLAGPRGEEAHQAVFQYDEKQRLPLIKSPTLLLYGTEDTFFHRREATARLVPRCRTEIIQGAGALIALEKPNAFAQSILEFLKNPGV